MLVAPGEQRIRLALPGLEGGSVNLDNLRPACLKPLISRCSRFGLRPNRFCPTLSAINDAARAAALLNRFAKEENPAAA